MPTAPTPITPLPTAPSRADPANFPARADAFLAALPTFGSQLNANASAAFTNASEAGTAANNAAASQTSAAASATAAAASAVTAVNAPGTSGTSTTSLTIGTGSQTFTTQGSKAWVVGQFVTVASTASPTNFMHGQITAYNSGTGSMTVDVLAVGGSGTLASWTIGLVGPNATLTDQNSLQPVALTLPSIRPSLLLDFANAKKLDPRITFSRATSGTYYDGVTSAKADENLLLRSQDFSTTWTLANLTAGSAVTAPDATATGSSFTASAGNGTLTQSVTAVAGDHTFSVWLRRVSGTGNIDITAHSGGTWVTQTITSSWARYTVTQTLTAGSRTPGIRIVTSGDQIEVWGAQLEQRSAATAYTPTTTQPITNYVPQLLTAPAGVPRFDHNPTTGESLGLLVEEQRTNLLTYSADFSNPSWSSVGLSTILNSAVGPDGLVSAAKLVENAASGLKYFERIGIAPVGLNTLTIFAKAAGRSWIRIGLTSIANGSAWFDLQNGVTGTKQAAISSSSITAIGNGWYRCTIVCTLGVTSNLNFNIATGDNVTSYTGDGYSGIYIWGPQIETGAFPTSYIPTTSASVTRTADEASMTGVNFSSWYRQDEGTMFAEMQRLVANAQIAYAVGTGNLNATNSMYALLIGNGNTQFSSNGGISIVGGQSGADPKKTCAAYKANDNAWVINGSVIGTDTSSSTAVVADTILLAGAFPIANNCGYYRKLAYYPQRLTNAELQALTA